MEKAGLWHTDVTVAQLDAEAKDRRLRELARDANRDGIPDELQTEVELGKFEDLDGNGLNDKEEAFFGQDSNGNGILDSDEREDEDDLLLVMG